MKTDKELAEEYLKKLKSIKTADDLERAKETIPEEMKKAALRYAFAKGNKEYLKAIDKEAKRLWKWLK